MVFGDKNALYSSFLITDVKYTSLVENVYPLIQTFIRNKNCRYAPGVLAAIGTISECMGKTFQAATTNTWELFDLWCVVLYVAYSTTHQRLVEVQFGRYQKTILQEWYMVKNLLCVSCGSLKRFPHTFTNDPVHTYLLTLFSST